MEERASFFIVEKDIWLLGMERKTSLRKICIVNLKSMGALKQRVLFILL